MKKVILIVAVLMIAASLSSAQPMESNQAAIAAKTEAEHVTGKVEEVSMANPEQGTKSMVTIMDSEGAKIAFEVTPATAIYNVEMKPIGIDAIQKDMMVKIKGTSKEGVGVAASIMLIK
ncbi:MAG: hypothetical protein V1933_08280 [Candidatus Omnitrophota bacterium]